MIEDAALLRQFASERSDAAFRELVRQRIDFVYAAALRQVGGDACLAQEVAQNVFLDLARKAHELAKRSNLTGWLHTSTRFAAAKALRSRVRRLNHETEAHAMQEILSARPAAEINWNELRPVIDAALHELRESDRAAILLRFFEGRSLAEVGAAIGLAENSARMRIERALEKLRARLARRGITSTAAALGVALATQPLVAAPAGCAASAAGFAITGAAAGGGVVAAVGQALTFMSITKVSIGLASLALAFLAGMYFSNAGSPAAAAVGIPAHEPATPASLVATLRAANANLKKSIDQLEAEHAATTADAAQARARTAQIEAQLRAVQVAREAEIRVQKQRAMLNNLRQIAAARDQLQLENGRPSSVADLVGPDRYIRALNPADGEDYTNLDLGNRAVLSVTSANGVTATYYLPPPAGIRAPWTKALGAYQAAHNGEGPPARDLRALLPYFQTTKEAADYAEWFEGQKTAGR